MKSRAATIVLVVYLLVLGFLVFWPQHIDPYLLQAVAIVILEAAARHSWSAWMSLESLNDIANVVLFFPFGLVATLAFGWRRWWLVALVGVGISAAIEGVQLLFLPGRTADPSDIVSGAVGVILGALLGLAIARARDRRHRRPPTQTPAGGETVYRAE